MAFFGYDGRIHRYTERHAIFVSTEHTLDTTEHAAWQMEWELRQENEYARGKGNMQPAQVI